MLISAPTQTVPGNPFLFGLTLAQSLNIGLLLIIAAACVTMAIVMTSKFFYVRYVSLEDKEALDFSREMRDKFREWVVAGLAANSPDFDSPPPEWEQHRESLRLPAKTD
jgi:hypothetical protein